MRLILHWACTVHQPSTAGNHAGGMMGAPPRATARVVPHRRTSRHTLGEGFVAALSGSGRHRADAGPRHCPPPRHGVHAGDTRRCCAACRPAARLRHGAFCNHHRSRCRRKHHACQRELAAPQTDRNHIALRRDADGNWFIRNLSATRQVVLLRDASEQRLGSLACRGCGTFRSTVRCSISAAPMQAPTFTRAGHEWRYDGAMLYRDGHPQASCPDARLASKALAAWNRWMPLTIAVRSPSAATCIAITG
jgi:hypothetical protein